MGSNPDKTEQGHVASLTLGALGVVFGDIGTNPLFALRQCFKDLHEQSINPSSVLGILSLIFWSLILVVCIKYVTFIMRADHKGEGGTLAMLALLQTRKSHPPSSNPTFLVLMVLFGSALLYGDGVVTPAISVLAAVEGLKIAVPSVQSLVVPFSLVILTGLFLIQPRGTGTIGKFFSPIMSLWFLVIGTLGVIGIIQAPQILNALNPLEAGHFFMNHGLGGMLVLGGVVLCFAGAEALFADLSHFGRRPIQLAWYGLVLPALILNYFGQGALMLVHPEQTGDPFFALVPHQFLLPVVVLATMATVIASQALISGIFTLTQQAIYMRYFPPFEIVHTSEEEGGQIYIGAVNWIMMAACVSIVVGFRSSEGLGGAYGLAVIGTMITTSLTYFFVLRKIWRWPLWSASLLVGFFLLIDVSFLGGNVVKIISGAWVPLVIALFVFSVFWIWTQGHARYRLALEKWSMPSDEFCHEMKKWKEKRIGTSVFLSTKIDCVPLIGKNSWLREHVRSEKIFVITIKDENVPYVSEKERCRHQERAPGFHEIIASFGFMQHPDVMRVLKSLENEKFKIDWDKLVCYLPEARIVNKGGWFRQVIQQIYDFLRRNSVSAASYFRVPPRQIIQVGVEIKM